MKEFTLWRTDNAMSAANWILSRIFIMWVFIGSFSEANSRCPKACNPACHIGSLSCQNGGLTQLPDDLYPGTTKIILIGHRFYDSTLRVANLSRYGSSNFGIESMFIQNCSVRAIEPTAFHTLNKLRRLDLAQNHLTDIVADTFTGLNLLQLRLDSNHGLRLNVNSFRGLIVKSLSLNNCNLKTLHFGPFRPIAGQLNKLNLAKNSIQLVDPAFDPLFHNLETVDLTGNPLQCVCDLKWLAKLFQWKIKYGKVKKGFGGYNIYPRCATPSNLANVSIHKVPDAMFYCDPPHLKTVEIDFTSSTTGRLRCEAKGSPYMRIKWDYLTRSRLYVHPPYHGDPSSAIMIIRKMEQREHYACNAMDRTGNVSANVRISWPPEPPKPPPFSVDLNTQTKKQQIYDQNRRDQYISPSKKPRDQETISNPRPEHSSGEEFLFRKQFTLLEMIGAVVGTFTVTLAIFLVIYRCLDRSKKQSNRIQRPTYSHYEPAAYSDSQTYDLPTHATYLPPPLPPGPGPFLDFKTQRKLYN